MGFRTWGWRFGFDFSRTIKTFLQWKSKTYGCLAHTIIKYIDRFKKNMAKQNSFHVVDLVNNEQRYRFDVCGKATQTYKGLRSPYTLFSFHFVLIHLEWQDNKSFWLDSRVISRSLQQRESLAFLIFLDCSRSLLHRNIHLCNWGVFPVQQRSVTRWLVRWCHWRMMLQQT